jgi:hypothetical protein
MPEIALQPPRHPDRNTTRPVTTHAWSLLYRRLIEIHDGLRRLQPYIDPSLRTAATQQAIDAGAAPGEATAAGVTAAITNAFQQMAAGDQPQFTGARSSPNRRQASMSTVRQPGSYPCRALCNEVDHGV